MGCNYEDIVLKHQLERYVEEEGMYRYTEPLAPWNSQGTAASI